MSFQAVEISLHWRWAFKREDAFMSEMGTALM